VAGSGESTGNGGEPLRTCSVIALGSVGHEPQRSTKSHSAGRRARHPARRPARLSRPDALESGEIGAAQRPERGRLQSASMLELRSPRRAGQAVGNRQSIGHLRGHRPFLTAPISGRLRHAASTSAGRSESRNRLPRPIHSGGSVRAFTRAIHRNLKQVPRRMDVFHSARRGFVLSLAPFVLSLARGRSRVRAFTRGGGLRFVLSLANDAVGLRNHWGIRRV
jgi:hypothetical protein